MKKLYTLLLFAAVVGEVHAQSYIPIPQTNAAWLHTWHSWNWMEPDWKQKISTDGDTLINSTTYTKVRELTQWPAGSLSTSYLAAFRNDDANQRVYIVPKDSSTEYLMYDFNVAAGDTVKNAFCMSYFGGFIEPYALMDFHVIAVDSFLLNSNYHRIVTVKTDLNQSLTANWFEGFGSDQGLLGTPVIGSVSYWQDWDCATFGSSYFSNIMDSVLVSAGPCQTNLSIASRDLAPFVLSPNPATSSFSIVPPNSAPYVFEVYSNLGERMRSKQTYGTAYIDMETYAPGVYHVRILSEEGFIEALKLVKL